MAAPAAKIDRQTTTPFHLKLFYRTGGFHRLDDFPTTPTSPLPPHLQIYTWPTCTLRELSHLLTSALPTLLPSPAVGTRLSYRLVFPDTRDLQRQSAGWGGPPRAKWLSKELGSIVVGGEGLGNEDRPDGEGAGRDPETNGKEGVGASAKVVKEGVMAGRLDGEPEKTLQEARFVIGDYIDCAIFAPLANGDVAPPASGGSVPGLSTGPRGEGYRGGYSGGARENGNGFGGFRGRGGGGGGGREGGAFGGRGGGGGFGAGRLAEGGGFRSARMADGNGDVPSGEWRRGERLPDGGGRGYGRGRGRGGY